MIQNTQIDATRGSLVKMIWRYAIPLALGTLIQSLFNAVDIVVLGGMADSGAVASVGATTTIVNLIVNSFIGLSTGCRVILARLIGAGEEKKAQKTADTSLLFSLAAGVFIAIVGFVFAPHFLRLTKCPDACFDGAVMYIRIYICSAPAILFYNFGSAVLNETGDTQRPLYYLIACGFLNAVMNVILCLILPQKVAAVAIATALSQILGAVLVFTRLMRMDGIGKLVFSKISWSMEAFGKILRYGLPIALSQAMYPVATLQIQTAINSYGVSAIAGNSAAITVGSFASSIADPFGKTATTFIGQNLGAAQPARVRKSFSYCILFGSLIGFLLGGFLYFTGSFWLSFILPTDPEAVEYALIRMAFIVLPYGVAAANGVLSHALQAYGYSLFTTVDSVFFVLIFRIFWMNVIYPKHESFSVLMACFLVSWLLMLVVNGIAYAIVYIRYRKGKYRNL